MTDVTYGATAPAAREARIAGGCYVLVIAGGVFAQLFVREPLFASGSASATATAIAANESLWRWGIAVHLLYLIPGAIMNAILYRLLKVAHATMALIALVLAMCDVAIEAMLLTSLFIPLVMIGEGGSVSGFSETQRQAFAHLAIRVFFTGWSFALLLFSGFCALTGVLILRSRLIPRVIGALMIAAGGSYFISSLAGIVAPNIAQMLVPWILVPSFIGESALGIWLLVRGVRTRGAAP